MNQLSLLILRLGISAMMLTHGIPKLQRLLSGDPIQFPQVFGMSAEVSMSLAMLAEVGCSVLIILGLATRYAAIPPAIIMAVVVFVINAGEPFAKVELPLLYLLGYVLLIISGGGKYSLDQQLRKKNRYRR